MGLVLEVFAGMAALGSRGGNALKGETARNGHSESGSGLAYRSHLFFKMVAVEGLGAHGAAVVVDSLRREEKEGGHLRTVGDAHAQKGEDA